MCLRLPALTSRLHLRFVLTVLMLTVTSVATASAQASRPGQPLRDLVKSIERAEMDRMLLLKPLIATKDDSARRAVLKQITEDFRDMQGLNNKMMADAWAKEELDYRYISDTLSQIRGKATRLKSNLSLPEAETKPKKVIEPTISSARQFRAELLGLDRLIMSFVTNPLFQKANVVEVDLALRASRDLSGIIDQTARIKKTATHLRNLPKTLP